LLNIGLTVPDATLVINDTNCCMFLLGRTGRVRIHSVD
jgi:hypothetical protein